MLDFAAPAGCTITSNAHFSANSPMKQFEPSSNYAECLPTEQTQVVLEHMHGAASRVPVQRNGLWSAASSLQHQHCAGWTDPAMAEKCIDWTRGIRICTGGLRRLRCLRELSRR